METITRTGRWGFLVTLFLLGGATLRAQEHDVRGLLREPVRLNGEQAKLLSDARRDLDDRITLGWTELRTVKREKKFDQAKGLLAHWVELGTTNVTTTRAALKESSSDDRFRGAAEALFSDLAASCENARHEVEKATIDDERDLNWTSDSVASVLGYTSRVYSSAANTRALTFDLVVRSDPQGAKIRFYRQGENPTELSRNTNDTIYNLVYARWFVEVHLDAHKDQVKEHDATRERVHDLYFKLAP